MTEQDIIDVEVIEEDDNQLTDEVKHDELFMATLRRAMADVMKLEADADKKLFEEALAKAKKIKGKRTLEIKLPNGEVIASQSETVTEEWVYDFHDKEAFNTWLEKHYPDYFEEKEVEVEQTFTEAPSGIGEVDALLNKGYTSITVKREETQRVPDDAMVNELLDDADIEDNVIYDPELDEEIPGVTGEQNEKVTKSGFRFKKSNNTKRQLVEMALTSGIQITSEDLFKTLELESAKADK
ncbi:hypothetical protein GCM10009720_21170 [Yaniella flava]|uniref:Uncharacterized protein n=1 Tax=Yaniella flava TaxID=287930 RepID=A0ABP5G7R0_9MICC|nr:hypothetical protein [Micrococcaceae bacterium]